MVLFYQALDGFIMIITTDGQLFYVSESVKDFLGYSQVPYTFNRTFSRYSMHVTYHDVLTSILVHNTEHARLYLFHADVWFYLFDFYCILRQPWFIKACSSTFILTIIKPCEKTLHGTNHVISLRERKYVIILLLSGVSGEWASFTLATHTPLSLRSSVLKTKI